MEICQEKVCCVSLKTKQVVAGQHQGGGDRQGGGDHCGQDQGGEDDKGAEKNDEDCGTFELLEEQAEQQKLMKTSHFSRREIWYQGLTFS